MESPEPTKPTTTTVNSSTNATAALVNSPQVQESPFTSFLSNLSPIDLVKAPHISQGFLTLNSPPLVFTSPHINPNRETGFLLRSQTLRLTNVACQQNESGSLVANVSVDSDYLNDLSSPQDIGIKNTDEVGCSSLNQVGTYLVDSLEGDCTKGVSLVDANDADDPESETNAPLSLSKQGEGDLKEPSNVVLISEVPVDNTVNDEASQQRGMSRRCLQFEETRPKAVGNRSCSSNVTAANSFGFNSNTTSNIRQPINVSQSTAAMSLPQNNGKPDVPGSRPAGIGLHLNSIVKGVTDSCSSAARIELVDGPMNLEGHKPASMSSCSISENIDDPNLSNQDGQALILHEDTDAAIAADSIITESLETTKPMPLMLIKDDHSTPFNKKKLVEENVDGFDEPNSQSPRKKKKKVSFATEGDGCKRCNCKKTSCLKLYCDCFAASIYCAGACSCQGCQNRPEYEATVLETRQHIESRNPLAFAPKIVEGTPENSAHIREDVNRKTPASARHKRGCNCKKSMCLKKYCECYQANVGCSSGCRCEGCKNIYGKKEEYVGIGEMVTSRGVIDIDIDRNDSISIGKQADPSNLHKLTPMTPSFQSTDHGNEGPKSRIIVRKYNPRDAKAPSSPRNAHKSGPDCISSEMTGYFSSQFGSQTDTYHITPTTNPQSSGPASLFSSKARKLTHTQLLPLGPGTGRLSSGGSLHWRSSPITPMAHQLNESKIQEEPDLDNDILKLFEDDSPESLDLTPMKSVKSNSPNSKRVSPPSSRMNEFGSSSSGVLKSGRKFILKSVPAFPPLTPCIKSKAITNQTSDPEQNSSKN